MNYMNNQLSRLNPFAKSPEQLRAERIAKRRQDAEAERAYYASISGLGMYDPKAAGIAAAKKFVGDLNNRGGRNTRRRRLRSRR